MVDETKFFAWLDGELSPDEAAKVEAAVAADPELARVAEEQRSMAAWLRQSFDRAADGPVPEHLQRMLAPNSAEVVNLAERRNTQRRHFPALAQWAAMAATLAIGVFVGTFAGGDPTQGPVEMRGATLYAAGAVDAALDQQLASAGSQGAVRIGLTFRDDSGAICRTFETAAAAGLACRHGGDWAVRGMFAAPEGSGSDYRMAAGADPRLMELVDSTLSGEPFDAQAEAQAKQRGWR